MPEPIITTALARIQTDPVGENPTATAFFSETTTIGETTFQAPWSSVSWPLMSDKTVTVGAFTLTYAQVSALVTAIAYQEKAAV